MFSLAFKNILFYKGRSLATLILTFLSTLLFIIFVSMQDGSHKAMLKNSLKIYTGAIEIYHKDYRDLGGNEYLIEDVKSITDKLSRIEGIEAFSSRYETFGLLCTHEYSAASSYKEIFINKNKEIFSNLASSTYSAALFASHGFNLFLDDGLLYIKGFKE